MAKIRFNTAGAVHIITQSAKEGMVDVMQEVLHQAQADAPFESGELKDSGHMIINPKSIRVTFDAPHALIQHENLEYNHPTGKAKYLEDAFNSIVPGAIGRMNNKIKRDLRSKP